MNENHIKDLVLEDKWMMDVLKAARSLDLPDWMIGAGFIRNKVWDYLHGLDQPTVLSDIDLIYFDPNNTSEDQEKEYDRRLNKLFPAPWSTKNQARMHSVNGNDPYLSSEDALAHWIETPTCTAVKLLADDSIQIIAPHGLEDLLSLQVRPSPNVKDLEVYKQRIEKKNWKNIWPKLEIHEF